MDLAHVQANGLWVKMAGRKVWMAMAMAVPPRLWLGGVVSAQRDGELIKRMAKIVRSRAASLDILACVDGLASYVIAFLSVFRNPVYAGGEVGRDWYWKRGCSSGMRVVGVRQCVVLGTPRDIGPPKRPPQLLSVGPMTWVRPPRLLPVAVTA